MKIPRLTARDDPLARNDRTFVSSLVIDTGVLRPETQGVTRGDPRAQCALNAVHGRLTRGRPHKGLAEVACAARCETSALRDGQEVERVHYAVGVVLQRSARRPTWCR